MRRNPIVAVVLTIALAACGDRDVATAPATDSALTGAAAKAVDSSAAGAAVMAQSWSYCSAAGTVCTYTGLRDVRLIGTRSGNFVATTSFGGIPCGLYAFGNKNPAPGETLRCEYGIQRFDTLANPMPGMGGLGQQVVVPRGAGGEAVALVQTTGERGVRTDGSGSFRTTCSLADYAFIDPIVYPGQPGASHLHAFFGHSGVTASSTPASLHASGASTCRGGAVNRTAYWMPAVIDARSGSVVTPLDAVIYYKTGYNVDPASIRPFPDGLQMIAGNKNASSLAEQPYGISWGCAVKYVNNTGSIPTTCPVGDAVRLTVIFPQCWDGTNLDSPDHKSHMAYPIYRNSPARSSCPSTHPVALPEITEHFDFPVVDATAPANWRLASDMYSTGLRGGFSAHADWMNGWDRDIMATIVRSCLNAALDCGVGGIGDGRSLISPNPAAANPVQSGGGSTATVPAAPNAVAAVAGDASATVRWQAPTSNGGSAVTSYTVTASPGGASVTVSATATSATVTGLANGTSYTFTVRATNAVGAGAPSSASNAVTPGPAVTVTAPGAPRNVAATAGNALATITWDAPASDGGSAISGYTVTAAPGGATVSVAGSARTASVTGLANGTSYTFTVRATNSVGASPASQPSNAVTPVAPVPPPSGATRWVSGYWVGYQRNLYPETQVDFSALTHIFVGALVPTATGGVQTSFYLDNTTGPQVARTLSTRAHQAGRKAILMLGGSGSHDAMRSASSGTYRARFVQTLLATMDNLGYDGIDVDWEPIASGDEPYVLALLRDLRAARPGMLLTIPVDWVSPSNATFYRQVADLVDQMNIMSYGMAGNWGGWDTWHSSALFGDAATHPSSISRSVAAYRAAGVPAAKLGIGLGLYGQCWRGTTEPRQALSSGAGVVASDNTMSYANIMASYYSASASRWDDAAKVPYLTYAGNTGPAGCTYITYEDARSIQEKGAFVKAQGLGGAIVWTIQQGRVNGSDPLLQAAYRSIAQ